MKTKILLALQPVLVALGFLIPNGAFSHANLLQNSTIKPRDNLSPQANKTPAGVTPTYDQATMLANPGDTCGQNPNTGVLQARASGQPVTNLAAGQTLTVNWVEYINHTGWFQIWFSPNANDTAFVLLKDQIPHMDAGAAPKNYTTTVTVPAQNCSTCVIRMVQVMTDNHPTMPTYYYSCANVTITPDGSPPSGGTTSGSSSSGSSGTNCP
jgi:hypothetical protein